MQTNVEITSKCRNVEIMSELCRNVGIMSKRRNIETSKLYFDISTNLNDNIEMS